MKTGDDLDFSLVDVWLSDRDKAAELRDRAAEDRDFNAQVRDGVAGVGERQPWSQGRELAARDREEAAKDRAHAARDRELASHELANEGVDVLTGVMGRRVGLAAIQREMDRAERSGESLVVAFIDTVGLKAINDSQGHAAGDRALQDVAGCIRADLRSYDLVARVGGDEFVCTLSGQSLAEAGARFEKMAVHLAMGPTGAGMTVGFAALQAGDSLEQLVDRADQAMIGARR
jgi:diguanylate cyclase (GGDEF)-like protein